jgi:hypothetical protein
LDNEFKIYIKMPDFKFSQIKLKFKMARFYAEGLPAIETARIEDEINWLLQV